MIIYLTKEEQKMLWNENMEKLRDHFWDVFNNIEKMEEYKVYWNSYSKHKERWGRRLTLGVGKPPKSSRIHWFSSKTEKIGEKFIKKWYPYI